MTDWKKAEFYRFERSIHSSTRLAEVMLRVGEENVSAYVKTMGNPAGPHVLACEWIGSRLAQYFGLSTLDFGIIRITKDDEIPLFGAGYAEEGPAFASRKEPGRPWSGKASTLDLIVNPEDIAKLVVFDTWILNPDRFPPGGIDRKAKYDNVFLSKRDGIPTKKRLLAMDHTHCFSNGREISARIANIGRIKDERIYGLFPAFRKFLTLRRVSNAVSKLCEIRGILIDEMIDSIPVEWGVSKVGASALRVLIVDRARFLADHISDMLRPHCATHQGHLFSDGGDDHGGK